MNFIKHMVRGTLGAALLLSAAAAQADEGLTLAAYADRSMRVVSTARIHFEIADKLREAVSGTMAPVGALPGVFAAGYDVRDGYGTVADLDAAVAEYRASVDQISAALEADIAFIDKHKLNLPESKQPAVDELVGQARASFQGNIDRVDQIVGDVISFAKGADNYLAQDGEPSDELQALILPLMRDTMLFAETSLAYEIDAVEPFVSPDLGAPVYFGINWDYLQHMRHSAKWAATLGEGLLSLTCTPQRTQPDIAPLSQTLRAMDAAFKDPDDIGKSASTAVFFVLLQVTPLGEIPESRSAARSAFEDANSNLVEFEVDTLQAVDRMLAEATEENFASCALVEENGAAFRGDLQSLLVSVPHHPRRRSLRARQYAKAMEYYQALEAEGADD